MKAAFKKGQKVVLKNITFRPLKAGEIRIKVIACGICGSDLHVNPDDKQESPFGHEITGRVLELGPGVTGLDLGQDVMLESASACGRCDNCRNARQELCADIQSFWYTNSFGFAEEMITPAICAIPFTAPAPDVATLAEPLGVAIDLVRLSDITPDSNVLLMGAGPIGLMALALVKRMGARRIFVSEFGRRKARVRLAKKFGADWIIDPLSTPLEKYAFGCDINRVLVTTPPPTLASAIKIAVKGGIVSFIGIAHGPNAICSFNANEFHFKKLQLRASFASPALFTPLALQYLREGVVNGPALISHRFPLAQIARAMRTARSDEAVKVVVMP